MLAMNQDLIGNETHWALQRKQEAPSLQKFY